MTRFRITIRGGGVELRGYIDGDGDTIGMFSELVRPFGIVVASVAADDYDPYKEDVLRELHHFETEEILARIKAARSNHPDLPVCEKHPDPQDFVKCGWKAAIQDIDKVLAEVPE